MPVDPDFIAGCRDGFPLAVSILPFGTILAATAVGVGFSPLQTIVMGAVIFGGVAQAAVIDLTSRSSSIAVIAFTGLVVNIRYVMYSGSLAPHFQRLSARRRSLLSTLLVDQVYALAITKFQSNAETSTWWYYLGAGVTMWLAWVGSHTVGAVVGSRIPDTLQLEFVLPLVFVSLLFTAVEDTPTKAAAVVAAVTAIAGTSLPLNAGLIVGAIAGVIAGLVTEAIT